ncbi:hypothetical protein FKM82_022710, partial [Ascaphus truei]
HIGEEPARGQRECVELIIHILCEIRIASFHCGVFFQLVLQEWTFERDSWIHYQIQASLSLQTTHVQLMARTRDSFCTLLSLASKDRTSFLRLEVADGHFAVRFNFGDRENFLRLLTLRIDHGQWTLLSLERYDNAVTLRIGRGGGDREVTSVMGKSKLFEVDSSNIVLGNSLPQQAEHDFQG